MILAETVIILALTLGFAAPGVLRGAEEPAADRARRAGLAMTDGHFAEAIAIWAALVRDEPENVGLRLNLGLALHGAGRYREAASELERVLKARPDFPAATLVLGLCYNRLHLPRRAIPLLEGALRSEPRNEDAQLELATAYREDGQYWRAAEMLRVLAPRDRSNPHIWHQLLLCYVPLAAGAGGNVKRLAYTPAAEQKPPGEDCTGEAPACRFARTEYWALAREPATGEENGERAWWRHRAVKQLIADALQELNDIPSPDTCELLAEVYDALGRHTEAVEQWKAALELAPGDVRLQKALAKSMALAKLEPGRRP